MSQFQNYELSHCKFLFSEMRKAYSETVIPKIVKVALAKTKLTQEALLQYCGVVFVSYVGG